VAYPVSAAFEAQRTADSNAIARRITMLVGDYAVTGLGSTWNAQSELQTAHVAPLPNEDSIFDAKFYAAADAGGGIRSHRNYGDAEGKGEGRGWQGGMRFSNAGVGLPPGAVQRDIDLALDSQRNNIGKKLAMRFVTPGPAGQLLKQLAMRMVKVGAPAMNFHVETDAAGIPSNVNVGAAIAPTAIVNGWMTIDLAGLALASATQYWLVLDAGTAPDHYEWTSVDNFIATEYGAEDPGTGWVGFGYRLHLRTIFDYAGLERSERLAVSFTSTRTIDTIRVYSYPTSSYSAGKLGIRKFRLETNVGAVFTAATIASVVGSDLNRPNLTPTVTGGSTVEDAQATFFEIKLAAPVAVDGFRLVILSVQDNATYASVLSAEAYLDVETTARVTDVGTRASRDTFLKSDQARTVAIALSNGDRFFSPRYLPTPAQTSAGFLNGQLRPNLEVRVFAGFFNNELVPLGVYYIDSIGVNARARTADFQATDWAKFFERTLLNETAQVNVRVENLVELVGNRSNWSSSRMVLAQTESISPLFAPNGTTARQEMDLLAEAGPFGTVRFDEQGTMRFITFLPSSGSIEPLGIRAVVGGIPRYAGANIKYQLMMRGEKLYWSWADVSTTNIQVSEYDIPTRTSRQLATFVGTVFNPALVDTASNLALDAAGTTLFFAHEKILYKVDLVGGGVTTLNIAAGVAPSFLAGPANDQGQVVGTRYYFTGIDNPIAGTWRDQLFSVDTGAFNIGSLITHGTLSTRTDALNTHGGVLRMVRWTPVPGVTDRLVFAFDQPPLTSITFRFWDLIGGVVGNDGIDRWGVTTDGLVLYQVQAPVAGVSNVTSTPDDVTFTTRGQFPLPPTPGAGEPNNRGMGVALAGSRLWLVYRQTGVLNKLRVINLLDGTQIDCTLTELEQASGIVDDPANGRAACISIWGALPSAAPAMGGSHPAFIRILQAPNNPVSSTLTVEWRGELLDVAYVVTDQNAGRAAMITGIRWVVAPPTTTNDIQVWAMTQRGNVLSPTNLLTLSQGATITLAARNGQQPGPRYIPKRPSTGRFSVPIANDFEGFICKTAAAPVTFGGNTGQQSLAHNITPSQPQALQWTGQVVEGGTQARLQAILTPHPTAPTLKLLSIGTGPIALSDVSIWANPFQPGALRTIEVLAGDVLPDGNLLRQQHGTNEIEIQNPYVSDSQLLELAAKEAIRLYGHPQDQVRYASITFTPQIQQEDIVTIREPESGLDMIFLVLGVEQVLSSSRAETRVSLLALPFASIFGVGLQAGVGSLTGQPSMESF